MSTENQRALFIRKISNQLTDDFRDDYDVPVEHFEAYRNGAKDAIYLLMEDYAVRQEFCDVMGIRVAFVD